MESRRLASAVTGFALLLGAVAEAVRQGVAFYQMFYLIPKQKYGVPTPLRWQDITVFVIFWLFIAGLGYLSYRLLRYAFRVGQAVSM
ncbi:MAG: hypothetical protein WA766_07120 [Candidatus Acidiferrales bacterium]